jgi:hypothetical protein
MGMMMGGSVGGALYDALGTDICTSMLRTNLTIFARSNFLLDLKSKYLYLVVLLII